MSYLFYQAMLIDLLSLKLIPQIVTGPGGLHGS